MGLVCCRVAVTSPATPNHWLSHGHQADAVMLKKVAAITIPQAVTIPPVRATARRTAASDPRRRRSSMMRVTKYTL